MFLTNPRLHFKLPVIFLFGWTSLSGLAQNRAGQVIRFIPDREVHRIELKEAAPDEDGVLARLMLELPDYTEGYYFSGDGAWPANANRTQAWAFGNSIEDLFAASHPIPGVHNPVREGYALVLKEKSGKYLYVLGLTTAETTTRFSVKQGGEVAAELVTWGTEKVQGNIPVVAWSRSDDFYRTGYEVWEAAASEPGIRSMVRLREQKSCPEPFDYLGWCSWEQYHKNINEELLTNVCRSIMDSDVPVRWVLVDDGHQDQENLQLISFNPSQEKFPGGWEFLTGNDRSGKIKWFGIWHCFNGLWDLIHKENEMPDISFVPADGISESLKVKADRVNIENFYEKMISSVREQGFDFVKIDVQASNMGLYRGEGNAVQVNHWCSQALENSCNRHLAGLINCMCMNSVCLFNSPTSNAARVSVDYHRGRLETIKSHIYQSYAATLWFGYVFHPDHDMFHSSDSVCGKMMAVSKALSGGPIYLSDAPEDFVEEYIFPLCFSDGRLIKPLAPAVPLQQSLCRDVFNKADVFSVVAPLSHKSAAIVSYNLTHPERRISASIGPDDYSQASAMLQPYPGRWEVPEEGLVIFDFYAMEGTIMDRAFRYDLENFSDRLFIVSPVDRGWAVIGPADKYLAPSAVRSVEAGPSSLKIRLYEGSNLVFWSSETPRCPGNRLTSLGNGFWLAGLDPDQRSIEIYK